MRLLRSEAPPPIFFIAFISRFFRFFTLPLQLVSVFHNVIQLYFPVFIHCIHYNFQFFPVCTKNCQ